MIKKDGVHIAFTAGTCILVFLDLVAHLIRKEFKLLSSKEDEQIHIEKFKFILYVSFPTRKDAVGHELCMGFHKHLI